MFEMIADFFRGFFGRVDYAIIHMTQFQWAIVSVVCVVFGFLCLRSQKSRL